MKPVLIILACMLIYQYGYNAMTFDKYSSDYWASRTQATYETLMTVEEKLPYDIYVYDSSSGRHSTSFVYQFYLNRSHIIPDLPEEGTEGVLILSNVPIDSVYDITGYYCYQIESNQYIYTDIPLLEE